MAPRIDFDAGPEDLLKNAYEATNDEFNRRASQMKRDFLNWMAYIDMAGRDSDLVNVHVPKIYSLIENKAPRTTKAMFGRRPYVPFEAERDEFKEVSEIQTAYFDDLLEKANFFVEGSLADKMKTLYGTAFMNVLPYYEKITEKRLINDPYQGPHVEKREAYRLRLRIETWAPWEVRVAPLSRDLETVDGCRYIIKLQLVSKRMIRMMYAKGMYPHFDIEKLDAYTKGTTKKYLNEHFGQEILSELGLPFPEGDDDICVLLRYESPERYIDSINGQITLRDGDNPWPHGKINCSRFCHIQVPHTTNRFWGLGEGKPAEPNAYLLNDLTSMTLNAHFLLNQPTVFYRKGPLNPDDIIFSMGSRIPVDSDDDRPISDDVQIHAGTPMPPEHFALMSKVERDIDLTSAEFENQRGETGKAGTTATEMVLAREGSDSRTELIIALNEKVFLTDFAMKALSIVEDLQNFNDVAESVGEENAYKVFTANPADLPGGFNFRFKGSDRVVNMIAKRNAHMELAEIAMMSPAAKPAGIIRNLYKLNDFTDEDLDEMFFTEEEMQAIAIAQMNMQFAAQQHERAVLAASNEASPTTTNSTAGPKNKSKTAKHPVAQRAQATAAAARKPVQNTGKQAVA